MPHELDPDRLPEVKVDSNAGWLQQALTPEQRRGLWQHPGTRVVGVVEFTSTSFTGHAEGEDKDPQVKVRITVAEVAQDNEQTRLVAEVMRAMMRRRKMNQTLDELGPGERDVEAAVAEALGSMPTEPEYEAHEERRRNSRRGGVESFA
ncbi:hypothetical protein ACIQPP_05400 [Streptomyces violaceusniger]|uniref:hypothetical protein n=1 Tax=Streptomyces violaceusniger TaxID=68280 RepID=UPI0009960E62|nr:hypothetical protein [Streptomyces hygroscopicus]AQW55256.1 hypothetical protein SHXM_08719 [Streptomyces hygroscopicus]